MTTYKLTYFDFDGGRAEPVRIVFHAAGIEFEDNRISFPEFSETRSNFRFGAVPVLEIDGAAVTQSNGMCRYIGKQTGLYPEDDLQALYCDEALGVVEDSYHKIVNTIFLEGDELKEAREKLVDNSADLVERLAPQLLEHNARVDSDPIVVAYYNSRS